MTTIAAAPPARMARSWYKILYVQVLFAILLGIIVGWGWPSLATSDWMKALGDGFIKLIKMVIAPIVFCTVVSGIAHIQDAKKVGRVGIKALVYFEIVSTLALVIGLVMGNLFQIGRGLAAKPDAVAVANYVEQAKATKFVDFALNIIPDSVVGALARGDILQVLLFAILLGFSLMALGERGARLRSTIDDAAQAVFGVIAIIMKAAPIGAFAAMAFTVGKFGPSALANLIGLITLFYATAALFVILVLGLIARFVGFSIFKFIVYIKDELLIVLGTSSSESALPQLMEKLERLGCSKPVVGLVVPTGYSFNLDGTNIYMTLATLFIARALGLDLAFDQQITILIVAMLTSKGASGVAGAGFITLAATLSAVNPALVPGMAIVFSIDKFMSEVRALTNIMGNGVAVVFVSWWEGELDTITLHAQLGRGGDLPDVETATAAAGAISASEGAGNSEIACAKGGSWTGRARCKRGRAHSP
ncbi:C4-dicarboxylate transporter DctA [Bradyrhizobium sp. CNPSo 4019]|uniref:C4-dicarboxylate transporter DctA n=1 Tax=Bradyrhizobium diversitatis TaxID=2755406 RepID=A0ABS0NZH4_9BRAD|nr:C4-dicarboxylate transporter DctA [Bradyrhizobium diversitatis]